MQLLRRAWVLGNGDFRSNGDCALLSPAVTPVGTALVMVGAGLSRSRTGAAASPEE